MRFSILAALVVLVAATPAGAQTPNPHKTPVMQLQHPAAHHGVTPADASVCNRNAVTAAQHVNPITGQKQAQTIVSVPLTKGSGSVASATNRQQQLDACAHGH
jgi:hypothetical protein